jgi:hypothetical protein
MKMLFPRKFTLINMACKVALEEKLQDPEESSGRI